MITKNSHDNFHEKKNKKEFPLKKDCTTKVTSHNMQKNYNYTKL